MSETLPNPEIDPDELIHENLVRIYNQKYPQLDALMCSVLLKFPPELLKELVSKPEMWITPPQTSTLISDAVMISDPVMVSEVVSDPDSVLDTPFN
jgi:hypothetical protein